MLGQLLAVFSSKGTGQSTVMDNKPVVADGKGLWGFSDLCLFLVPVSPVEKDLTIGPNPSVDSRISRSPAITIGTWFENDGRLQCPSK